MRRALAAMLAVILVVCPLTGCYKSADVLLIDDYAVYPGLYLYFQLQAISDAGTELGNLYYGKEVLKQTIEGIPAKEWIGNRTVAIAREFVFVAREFERLGLDAESLALELSYYESSMQSEWQQLHYFYSRNGIGYETYRKMFENNIKTGRVFDALYIEEGGEQEPPEDTVKELFAENYTYLDYLRLSKTTDDLLALEEEELESALEDMRGNMDDMLLAAVEAAKGADVIYAESVNVGLQAAFELYLSLNDIAEADAEQTRTGIVAEHVVVRTDNTSFEADIITELFSAETDVFQIFETEEYIYLFCRRSMLEYNEDSWKDYKSTIITENYSDTYMDYIKENSVFMKASESKSARRYFSLNKAFVS